MSRVCSFGCFISNWDAGNYEAAFGEIERFVNREDTAYDVLVKTLLDHLADSGVEFETNAALEVPGSYSREARGLKRRHNSDRNPIDHYDSFRRKQRIMRKRKTGGLIESDKKSKRAIQIELDRIRDVADIHDSPILNTRDE